ncbi:hypothetical protein [Chryseobacterium rhizosphaerae]|uniref:Lipoprotein n=1 Tax=Chryseobacterium rhizosphaerae TaxID=395937 RepID=A0ABX9IEW8_9FLAO|nr:hypothetical protein [Chryseobacterium rhizosphaerae]REC71308.1 hypothetical protein DRF57_20775 [Chryseobacterium rhizosphaerae]GEN69315.1 hypothetical protein CRH01_38830 [Chryseobacterium rhizosphaerae]
MKKTLFIISSLLVMSCASNNDLIYSQDEEQNLNLKEALPSLSNKILASNGGEITLMDLDLNKTFMQPDGGGCSFEAGYNIDNTYTSTAAFGPTPLTFLGYTIRGYGIPRTDAFLWKGIRFSASNKPQTTDIGGGRNPIINNNPKSNAISIEFPFQANFTYEIRLDTSIQDFIYHIKHGSSNAIADLYNVDQSQGLPTVGVELTNSPQIRGNDPCAKRPIVNNSFVSNYFKQEKAVVSYGAYTKNEFIFNFSLTESQNAIIIYFQPELSGLTPNFVPESDFSMLLQNVKIIQKPFDPSHVPSLPCNKIGGFRC